MKSLESKIRDLMIAIAMEQDQVSFALDDTSGKPKEINRLVGRRDRLKRLAHDCILNIDREIEFFQEN